VLNLLNFKSFSSLIIIFIEYSEYIAKKREMFLVQYALRYALLSFLIMYLTLPMGGGGGVNKVSVGYHNEDPRRSWPNKREAGSLGVQKRKWKFHF